MPIHAIRQSRAPICTVVHPAGPATVGAVLQSCSTPHGTFATDTTRRRTPSDRRSEVGSDFDGLTRFGLKLFLDSDSRLGIKTDWDYYLERLQHGSYDQMGIGDVTGTFRFLQTEQTEMHVGGGARFLVDAERIRAGYNLLCSLDVYPARPMHLFGSVEGGSLGNAAVWRLRGGAGWSWDWAEVFAGYDYLNVGGAVLNGPFVGLRLWF